MTEWLAFTNAPVRQIAMVVVTDRWFDARSVAMAALGVDTDAIEAVDVTALAASADGWRRVAECPRLGLGEWDVYLAMLPRLSAVWVGTDAGRVTQRRLVIDDGEE